MWRQSLRQYVISVGRWAWLISVEVVGTSVGLGFAISGRGPGSVWLWLALLMTGLIVGPFVAFHKVRIERDQYKAELDAVRSPTPNVEIVGPPYVDRRPILETEREHRMVARPYFAHASFRNNPEIRSDEATAKKVVAMISFFDDKLKPVLSDIYGRWADTQQPGSLPPFAPTRDLCEVDFEANGLPRELDIAVKYPQQEACYAFNNDSCLTPTWLDPRFWLEGHVFRVRVTLRGENVQDREWWFMLNNEGKRGGMTIETITSSPLG